MTEERSLNILLVDDEEIIHKTIGGYLKDAGHQVNEAYQGDTAFKFIEKQKYDLALIDIKMPDMDGIFLLKKIQKIRPLMPVVIITGHGTMETVIKALRLGAADFLTKPIKLIELDAVLERCIQIGTLRREKQHLQETIRGIQTAYELQKGDRKFIGNSPAMHKVREQIHQAVEAKCDTILITGETGTGKEVVSRQIHYLDAPEESPFIAVSCPALPESLLESELFGHMKGTFTGATKDRAGYFELAGGGTLLLDEIADLSPSAQATLLRVLETRKLRRVGGSEEIKVNVRLIASTNAPLEELIKSGKFRRDLYYRLNVYSIHLLPLRERRQDIIPLAEHFLAVYSASRNLRLDGFSREASELLMNYDYPGNARELRNIVELAAIQSGAGQIQKEHLSLPSVEEGKAPSRSDDKKSRDAERALILKVLEETKWNRRQAAKNLDMPYSTLRYKMKTMGID